MSSSNRKCRTSKANPPNIDERLKSRFKSDWIRDNLPTNAIRGKFLQWQKFRTV